MEKLSLRRLKRLAKGHTAHKRKSQDLNCLNPLLSAGTCWVWVAGMQKGWATYLPPNRGRPHGNLGSSILPTEQIFMRSPGNPEAYPDGSTQRMRICKKRLNLSKTFWGHEV